MNFLEILFCQLRFPIGLVTVLIGLVCKVMVRVEVRVITKVPVRVRVRYQKQIVQAEFWTQKQLENVFENSFQFLHRSQ